MQQLRADKNGSCRTPSGLVRVLVISQHDAVRRYLVAYLHRSTGLTVSGDELSADAIEHAHPDVLVLDLSRIGPGALRQALDTAHDIGARVIALASLRGPDEERAVIEAGGLYRLKSAGADGLADLILDTATPETVGCGPSALPG